MHAYIPKDKSKTCGSNGQIGDKTIFDNFDDLKVVTVNEKLDAEIFSMCIVPVKVQSDILKREVLTYAILDGCSQGSFMHKELVKELLLLGGSNTLNLKTLNGKKYESTKIIEGVDVRGVCGNNNNTKLPRMCTSAHLQVYKEKKATSYKIKQWGYLKV